MNTPDHDRLCADAVEATLGNWQVLFIRGLHVGLYGAYLNEHLGQLHVHVLILLTDIPLRALN